MTKQYLHMHGQKGRLLLVKNYRKRDNKDSVRHGNQLFRVDFNLTIDLLFMFYFAGPLAGLMYKCAVWPTNLWNIWQCSHNMRKKNDSDNESDIALKYVIFLLHDLD